MAIYTCKDLVDLRPTSPKVHQESPVEVIMGITVPTMLETVTGAQNPMTDIYGIIENIREVHQRRAATPMYFTLVVHSSEGMRATTQRLKCQGDLSAPESYIFRTLIERDPRVPPAFEKYMTFPIRIADWLDMGSIQSDGNAAAFKSIAKKAAVECINKCLSDMLEEAVWVQRHNVFTHPSDDRARVYGEVRRLHLENPAHPQFTLYRPRAEDESLGDLVTALAEQAVQCHVPCGSMAQSEPLVALPEDADIATVVERAMERYTTRQGHSPIPIPLGAYTNLPIQPESDQAA